MRSVIRGVAAMLSVAGVLGGAGCDLARRAPEGTRFEVRGSLVQDTCGPQAAPVLRTVVFFAELAVARDRATWRVVESGASATGQFVESALAFRFAQDSQTLRRDVDRVNGRAACVLRRLDVIDGALSAPLPARNADGGAGDAAAVDSAANGGDAGDAGDAGTAGAPTFRATETVVYGAVAGADCSDQVGADDGQFLALPCQQVFELRGTMVPSMPSQ